MNDDIIGMSSTNVVTSSIISNAINNNLERLEEHIDYLHTKISDMEDRIAILESIVLKKN